MRNKALFLVVLTALLIRLTPTLITNQPFSTDTWPLIRLSRALLSSPEYRVWDDSLLDGYHNKWPAVVLEGALYDVLTGLELTYFFRFVGVIITQASALTTTYVLVKKYRGTYPALLSMLVFTSIPSLVIFTSTTLKEVYAYPLALLFIALVVTGRCLSTSALAFLAAFSLTISHPLTPLMIIAFIGSYLFTMLVKRLEGSFHAVSFGRGVLAFSLLGLTYFTYMASYGWRGLMFKFGLSDFLTLFVLSVVTYGWYTLVGGDFTKTLLVLIPGVTAILVSNSRFLGISSALLYATPLIILSLLHTRKKGREDHGLLIPSTLLPISVGLQYIAIYSPLLMSMLHRILNYLFFTAIAITASLNVRQASIKRYALSALIISTAITAALLINLMFCGDPITYYWKYGEREVVGLSNLIKYSSGGKLCGDVKVKYLVGDAVTVDPLCGLELIKGGTGPPTVLYSDNFRFGYVLSPVDIYVIQGLSSLSLVKGFIYNNGGVYVVR